MLWLFPKIQNNNFQYVHQVNSFKNWGVSHVVDILESLQIFIVLHFQGLFETL